MCLHGSAEASVSQGYAGREPLNAGADPCSADLAATEHRLVELRCQAEAASAKLYHSIFGHKVSWHTASTLPPVQFHDPSCHLPLRRR